ncbi:serine/threonine-protein kinase [Bremerella sp. JC817]|uniref:serine/threonine protein kinase n=1 Tax=Bremerella sp. JC817 TaxID=3231756 RepID=UPI003457C2A5
MSFDREKSIFLSALDLPMGPQRDAYVAEECGDDRQLQAAVADLLSAHDRSVNVLDQQTPSRMALQGQVKSAAEAIAMNATWGRDSVGNVIPDTIDGGEFIGNYVLLEKLGEGGFGQVYVAQQQQPVKRRVAIKLLKATALSSDAIARFEAERQALAMMDHPNIARIFDGGTTASGQPYFVMELVRGVHITKFCRDHDQTVQQRLKLFLDVCHAVQHAHQKGIIHRDLKPSNVLVTLHDADAVVKVIDFGVAKALNEPLTERTIYTRFAQMIGTPMYMSPEQAEMNSLDVDTRSDIYSLGVLLYELLTEQTPFDQHRLQTASFDEMRRMIREEDPPRPSARLTGTTRLDTTKPVARQVNPRHLATELKGDLDWIVMKSLEKDRRRRYETAADLARDVQRFLDQQPVVARPPSSWYRFTRFARRNKTMFLATVIVLLSLVTGTIFSTWQAIRATIAQQETQELHLKEIESIEHLKEANVLLDSARANADEQRWQLALEQYTKAANLQPNHFLTLSGRGALLAQLGGWDQAAKDYAKALELGATANNPAWWGVPQLTYFAGQIDAYDDVCQKLRSQLEVTDDPPQITMIVRGICIKPGNEQDFKSLALRMESQLYHKDGRPDRGPRPGSDRMPPILGGRPGPMNPFRDDGPNGGPGGGPPGKHGIMEAAEIYAAGVANYRAGDTKRAIELLSQARSSNEAGPIAATSTAALALVMHQQGNDEQAELYLAETKVWLDQWMDEMSVSSTSTSAPWFDFLEAYIWYRQARTVIEGTVPQEDVRLRLIEVEAEEMLRAAERAVAPAASSE